MKNFSAAMFVKLFKQGGFERQQGAKSNAPRSVDGEAEGFRQQGATLWQSKGWMVKRNDSLILLERGIYKSFRQAKSERQQGAKSSAPRSVDGEAERFFWKRGFPPNPLPENFYHCEKCRFQNRHSSQRQKPLWIGYDGNLSVI